MDNKVTVNKLTYSKTSFQSYQGIKPFHEKPCESRFRYDDPIESDEIEATKLFSIFTADIIKEEVLFTR